MAEDTTKSMASYILMQAHRACIFASYYSMGCAFHESRLMFVAESAWHEFLRQNGIKEEVAANVLRLSRGYPLLAELGRTLSLEEVFRNIGKTREQYLIQLVDETTRLMGMSANGTNNA